MDICLLCLQLNEDTDGGINVTSTKWTKEGVEKIIEKHFWPLKSITSNSWLCPNCWKILNEFHKFYMRIEDAHTYFSSSILKTEMSESSYEEDNEEFLDNEICVAANALDISHYELEVPFDESTENRKDRVHVEKEGVKEHAVGMEGVMIPLPRTGKLRDPLQKPLKAFTKCSRTSKNDTQGRKHKKTKLSSDQKMENYSQSGICQTRKGASDSENPTEVEDLLEECAGPAFLSSELSLNTGMEDVVTPSTRTGKLRDPLQKPPKTSRMCSRTSKSERLGHKQKQTKLSSDQNPEHFRRSDICENRKSASDSENPTDIEDLLLEGADQTYSNSELSVKNRLYNDEQNKFVAENFTIKCGICQRAMQTFLDVCKHSAKEHKHGGFVICCNKKFYRRNILVEHINWHLNPQYFKCNDCGKVLADRRCLEVHARVHEDLEKTHMCAVCGKGFARPLALQRHKLSHLPNEERKFPCKHCPKKFGNNDLLVEHTRSAHLTKLALICYICGKGMRTSAVYKRHMELHEGIPQPSYSCDICGLKMANIYRLKTHKANKHPKDGKMDYKCHLCPKISPSPKALRAHVRYKHELGYDFKCTICNKAFKRALSLKEHMATHTGTELYTCPYCPRTFKSNANMHAHRKKAHPQKWEEAHREKYSGNLPPDLKIS